MKWPEIKQTGFYVYVDDEKNLPVDDQITIVQVVKDDEREFYWVWWIGDEQDSLLEHFNGDFFGPIELDKYLPKI